jgi:Zn-dependent protease
MPLVYGIPREKLSSEGADMGSIEDIVTKISIWALPLLLAITLHELGHAWAADKLGDGTARALGRVSLNPIRHIDPLGTILVPLLLLVLGGFVFGWAKPVPVDARNLGSPRRDMALVAVAGPIANLILAAFWALMFKLSVSLIAAGNEWLGVPLNLMARVGIFLNIVLCVLNLLPIPPLDGSSLVSWLLPARAAEAYNSIAPFGLFILIALVASGYLGRIINPPINALMGIIVQVFSLRL